jgi:tol-pal system protein YbgF
MLRRLLVCAALVLTSASATLAQEQDPTLADIRQELTILHVEVQRLRRELSTTGSPQIDVGGSTALERMDAIEGELRRLTATTEQLGLRINRVVDDGTNRVGDLEFRLCELEQDCDIGALGDTPSLGGEVLGLGSAPAQTPIADGAQTSLALSEQSDFDRAMAAFETGAYADASMQFEAFLATYPGGPLSSEAHFWHGEAEAAQGAWSMAARAYLDSFSGAPDAPRAAESLLKLGTSLDRLGQRDDACRTIAEVELRYPFSLIVQDARSAMLNIGCN